MNELKGPTVYVILAIREGEGFGFLQESSIVTCSLNGHTLQTDPCGVRSSPIFDSELIWETDKRTLRSLRLQNVPIKINITGVTGKKVGYLLLSLITATPCPSNKYTAVGHSWHRLLGLNAEAKSSEPKLLLRLIVSDSDKPNRNIEEIQTPRKSLTSPSKTSISTRNSTLLSLKNAPEILDDKNTSHLIQNLSDNLDQKFPDQNVESLKNENRLGNESKQKEKSLQLESAVYPREQDVHNVTFQSHSTSYRNEDSYGGVVEDHKTVEKNSPDTSSIFDDNSAKSSFQNSQPAVGMLPTQGDTTNKRLSTRNLLSPQTKEELVKRTVKALEKWKEKQQILYIEKLQQTEKLLLQKLENEWRHRETERDRTVTDCRSSLKYLQQALQDVTERTSQLSIKESKLRLAKEELEMLYMTKYHELNEAARRMEDDYNHQTKFHRLSQEQFETKLQFLEECNKSYKEKLKTAEEEVERLKRNSLSKNDIGNIKQQKVCLEQKLETALKSKTFYKDQWVSAVREANILKLKLSTNVIAPEVDPVTYRFQELLQNEESLLRLDSMTLRRLKDDIIHSERSDPNNVIGYGELQEELSSKFDIRSPSKKSVSYKSDRSLI